MADTHAVKVGPRTKESGKPVEENYTPPAVESTEVPGGMTSAETIEWVSGDKARAKAAIEAENKHDHPRPQVLSALDALTKDETGAGIASGEA